MIKQPISINFAKGLDLKTDPFQLQLGSFLSLSNSIFTKGGKLSKRNGFGSLTALPNSNTIYGTTFGGNLLAIGNTLQAYSQGSKTWINKGNYQPLNLSTQPIIRSNTNQSYADSVTASNGLVCTVFTDQLPSSLSTPIYKYVITDSTTGQNLVSPTVIPSGSGTLTNSPRIFLLGGFFVIVFTNVISGVNHIQYVTISTFNFLNVGTPTDIATSSTPSTKLNFDGVVANNTLYVAYNGTSSTIKMVYLSSTLVLSSTKTFSSHVATNMSVCADTTGNSAVIYAVFYDTASSTGYILATDSSLNTVLSPTQWITTSGVVNVTSSAQNGSCTIFYETTNAYSYDSSVPSNFISFRTCSSTGTLGTAMTLTRSVGLASKSFIYGGTIFVLAVYQSSYQPSYFLLNSSGLVVAKLAYSNGGGYLTTGLPTAFIFGSVVTIPYLFKDLIQAVNKNTNVSSGTQVAGIYSQTGINLASFNFSVQSITSAEIGGSLNLSGGFVWSYDGNSITENNFFVWPDNVELTGSSSGGSMTAQQYYYQVTYEWSDNAGNIHRSAPSIPVTVTTTGSTSSVTINVPTLRLTYKTA